MLIIFGAFLILGALGIFLLSLVFALECLLAMHPVRSGPEAVVNAAGRRPSVAVLVPANDEERSIGRTVSSIKPQLGPADRLIVVADHCADRTAEVAREAGAVVIERTGPSPRGKAHALNEGLASLAPYPPDVVVMVDADCVVSVAAVERLASTVSARGRPAQARNIVEPLPTSGPMGRISAFAFVVKNVVRPSGLAGIGLPCQLTGTGMALPWHALGGLRLAGGHLAEDLQLGIDLMVRGYSPVYVGGAVVSSPVPARPEAAWAQRRRWEHGHIRTLLTQVPRLSREAVSQRRWHLLVMALDLAVPPLSALGLLAIGGFVISALGAEAGMTWAPAALFAAAIVSMLVGTIVAWAGHGRALVPLRTLAAVPVYMLWKAPLYGAFLLAPQKSWERRSAREHDV